MSTPAFFQSFLGHERGLFSNVIGAVPDNALDYRPEPVARSARQLVEHLIGHNLDLQELLDDGVPLPEEAAAHLVHREGAVVPGVGGEAVLGDVLVPVLPLRRPLHVVGEDEVPGADAERVAAAPAEEHPRHQADSKAVQHQADQVHSL